MRLIENKVQFLYFVIPLLEITLEMSLATERHEMPAVSVTVVEVRLSAQNRSIYLRYNMVFFPCGTNCRIFGRGKLLGSLSKNRGVSRDLIERRVTQIVASKSVPCLPHDQKKKGKRICLPELNE